MFVNDGDPALDMRPRLLDPWWRKPLVWLGILKPQYGATMREYLETIERRMEQLSGINSVVRGEPSSPPHSGEWHSRHR